MNLNRLISSAHHRNNQFLLDSIINVLIVRVVIMSKGNGRLKRFIKI